MRYSTPFVRSATAVSLALGLAACGQQVGAPPARQAVTAQAASIVDCVGTRLVNSNTTLFRAIRVDKAGNFYVTSVEGEDSRSKISKYAPNGSLLWSKQLPDLSGELTPTTYLLPGSLNLALDGTGNAYVTVETIDTLKNVGYDESSVLLKYNKDGSLVWKKIRSQRPGYTQPNEEVAVDSNGNVYTNTVTSSYNSSTDSYSNINRVTKFNSSGTQLWDRSFDASGSRGSFNSPLAVSSQGFVFSAFSNPEVILTKRSTDGWLLSTKRFGRDLLPKQLTFLQDIQPLSLSASSDGSIYTLYRVEDNDQGDYRQFLNRYDAQSNWQWSKQVFSRAIKIASDAQGNIYVVGSVNALCSQNTDGSSFTGYIEKYAPNGNSQWRKTFGIGSEEYVDINDVAIDASGKIYVTGGIESRPGFPNDPGRPNNSGFVIRVN